MFKNMVFTSKRGKQIVFDDFCKDEEYNNVWVEMCPHCHRKYRGILRGRFDGNGSAQATCSVKGCNNEASYYVDFNLNEVKTIMEDDGRQLVTDDEAEAMKATAREILKLTDKLYDQFSYVDNNSLTKNLGEYDPVYFILSMEKLCNKIVSNANKLERI